MIASDGAQFIKRGIQTRRRLAGEHIACLHVVPRKQLERNVKLPS
jgi:hypothetical protein